MVETKPPDPISSAMEIFISIRNEVKDKEIGSKLRSRARDVAELIDEAGLIPTLSYLYSKKYSKEWDAHKFMLKAIFEYLKMLGLVKEDVSSCLEKSECVEMILQGLVGKSSVIVPLLRPFIIQFKRLCEAVWESER